MAEFRVPSRSYPVGAYGPFDLAGGVFDGALRVIVTLSVENWPQVLPSVCTMRVRWRLEGGLEAGADFPIASRQRNRDGTPRTEARVTVDIPKIGNAAGGVVNEPVLGCVVAFDVVQPFTTALSAWTE